MLNIEALTIETFLGDYPKLLRAGECTILPYLVCDGDRILTVTPTYLEALKFCEDSPGIIFKTYTDNGIINTIEIP